MNNAGIPGAATAPSQETVEDIRIVYETNVFGPIRVTQAFLPLLKAAGAANIVMVSSGLGSLGWLSDPSHPFYGVNLLGYNSSKSALNAVTVAFAKEFAPYHIRVNAADPGYTATDFNNHSGYRTVEQAAAGVVWLVEEAGPTGGFYFDRRTAHQHVRRCPPLGRSFRRDAGRRARPSGSGRLKHSWRNHAQSGGGRD